MLIGRFLLIIIFTTSLLTGCGILWSSVVMIRNGNPVIVASPIRQSFLYSCGAFGSFLQGFKIDYSTYAITPFSVPSASFCNQIIIVTVSSTLKLLVENDQNNGMEVFSIDPNSGALTAVSGSPALAGASKIDRFTVDPTNRYLYGIDKNTPTKIDVFSIDQTTGAIAYIKSNPFATGITYLHDIPYQASATAMYNIDVNNGIFTVMQIAPGDPTTMSSVAAQAYPAGCAGATVANMLMGGYSNFVFLSCTVAGVANIYAYVIGGGGVLTLSSSTTLGPNMGFTIDPTGHYLFTEGTGPGYGVFSFSIDQTTGALTPNNGGIAYGTSSINGFQPIVNPAGTILAANGGVFLMNGGVLTAGPNSPFAFPNGSYSFDLTGSIIVGDSGNFNTYAHYIGPDGTIAMLNGGPITTSGASNGAGNLAFVGRAFVSF